MSKVKGTESEAGKAVQWCAILHRCSEWAHREGEQSQEGSETVHLEARRTSLRFKGTESNGVFINWWEQSDAEEGGCRRKGGGEEGGERGWGPAPGGTAPPGSIIKGG